MRRRPLSLTAVLALPISLACGGDDLVLPGEGAPLAVALAEGDGQRGVVGAPLDDSVRVRVTDSRGRPVAGQRVVFVPLDASGSDASPDTAETDAQGRAATRWVLGTRAGEQRLEARLLWADRTDLRVEARATAMPGPAARLALAAGDGQTGEVGAALPDSLAVVARDDFDNPVPEVIVRWRAASGELSDAEVPTGADGRAAVQWTLGSTPGVQRASAEAAGLDGSPLDGSPVEFRATARLGPSPRLSIVTQPASSAVSGARLGRQPVVRIVTAAGAPVSQPDVAVTAAIASGGGGLGGTTTRTTDAQGVATFTDLAITGPPGPRTLIFAAPGFTAATSAEVQLLAPVPSSMAAVAGQGQTAAAGSAVATAPAVIVRDQTGAPLGGVTVTFTVTAGGGQLTGATPTTDAGGVARVGSWVLGTTAGNNRLEASVAAAGVSGNPITFTATGVPGPPSPAASVATVPDGRIFAWTTIVVTAYDQFGNRITGGGAAVAITVSGANNPGPLQVSDGGDGTYSASYLPVFTGTDQVTIVLNGVPLSGSPFASRVRLF